MSHYGSSCYIRHICYYGKKTMNCMIPIDKQTKASTELRIVNTDRVYCEKQSSIFHETCVTQIWIFIELKFNMSIQKARSRRAGITPDDTVLRRPCQPEEALQQPRQGDYFDTEAGNRRADTIKADAIPTRPCQQEYPLHWPRSNGNSDAYSTIASTEHPAKISTSPSPLHPPPLSLENISPLYRRLSLSACRAPSSDPVICLLFADLTRRQTLLA